MSKTLYHYDDKALNTLAILFGPGYIHLGSQSWIEHFCQDHNLSGKRILDFGSGAGGPACQIAKQFETAQILGLEFSPILVESARELATQHHLGSRVEFEQINQDTLTLTQKFDLIFSINTLSDCKNKDVLFTQLSQALRVSGTLTFMDWFHKSPNYSEATEAFFKFSDEHFYLNTPQEYLQQLESYKLSYVNFKDTTKNMLQECEALIKSLKTTHESEIVATFGAEYYEWWLEYFSLLYAALQSGDLLKGHISGVKT